MFPLAVMCDEVFKSPVISNTAVGLEFLMPTTSSDASVNNKWVFPPPSTLKSPVA